MRRAGGICRHVVAVLVVVLGASRELGAAPMTFEFTGFVTDVPLDEAGTGLGFGDAIFGSFTFESTATDLIPAINAGSYQGSGAPIGIAANIGGSPFGTNDFLAVSVANDFPQDQYAVLGCSGGGGCSGDLQIELFFQDFDGLVFGGDGLPLIPPALASFEIRDFHLIAVVGGAQLQVDGTIDSLTCASCTPAVPEPAPWLLVTGGFAALRWRRRPPSLRPMSHTCLRQHLRSKR